MQIPNLPAISGLDDASQGRVVLYQSGRLVHAPITKVGLQISSKLLDAIAGLTAAADKGIYFTGADSAATFDLPAASRTQIAAGLGTAATKTTGDFATAAQGSKADSAVQPGSLAAVATSGAYGDLSGTPTLGTAAGYDVGTSGNSVPRTNTANTWSSPQTITDIGGLTLASAAAANPIKLGAFSSTGATRGMQFGGQGIHVSYEFNSTAQIARFYNGNGQVGSITINASATAYNTSSDETLKDFIGPYDPSKAIAIIRADPVREFTWKSDGSYAVGWGAQTSYAVSPDLASPGQGEPGDEDYIPWGVDQSRRTPYLWAALTAVLDRLDEIESRLAALEAA